MKRKDVEALQTLVDSARLASNRADTLLCNVLKECKRAPYLNAEEIQSVFEDLDSANQDIEEAIEMLAKQSVKS